MPNVPELGALTVTVSVLGIFKLVGESTSNNSPDERLRKKLPVRPYNTLVEVGKTFLEKLPRSVKPAPPINIPLGTLEKFSKRPSALEMPRAEPAEKSILPLSTLIYPELIDEVSLKTLIDALKIGKYSIVLYGPATNND